MTAAEALASCTAVHDIAARAGADKRTVREVLDGYGSLGRTRIRILEAMATLGVDAATIPQRTDHEVQVHRDERRQKSATNMLPEGYTLERCDCGREYPRMISEATGWCPKCWRKHAEGLQIELEGARVSAACGFAQAYHEPESQ
jgi:hypothetical protein